MVSPRILAALVMVLWAFCYPLIALGLEYAPHLTFATLRAVLAGGVLLIVAMLQRAAWPNTWTGQSPPGQKAGLTSSPHFTVAHWQTQAVLIFGQPTGGALGGPACT